MWGSGRARFRMADWVVEEQEQVASGHVIRGNFIGEKGAETIHRMLEEEVIKLGFPFKVSL